MSKTQYTLEGGNVLRGGAKIATYNEAAGTIDFLEGMANYRAPVVRFLREQGKAANVPADKPKPIEPGPVATRTGLNKDRPVEENAAPLNPDGSEVGAPEMPPESEAPAPAPRGPAKIGDVQVDMVKQGGQKVPYKSRLTPEGWV